MQNDSLYADFYIIGYDKKVLGKLKSFVTDKMKSAYVNFERKGKTFKNHGPPSTTEIVYKITLNKDTNEFTDSRNEFDIYEKMKDEIFGQITVDNLRKQISR